MKYETFDAEAQMQHLKQRLAALEQEHYTAATTMELLNRLGDEGTTLHLREKNKLADIDKVYVQIERMIKELESAAEG